MKDTDWPAVIVAVSGLIDAVGGWLAAPTVIVDVRVTVRPQASVTVRLTVRVPALAHVTPLGAEALEVAGLPSGKVQA